MRLALVAPPQSPCPPQGYGGAERVCDALLRCLMQLGHEVVLFAGPTSTSPATELVMSKSTNIIAGEQELVALLEKRKSEFSCIIDFGACHLSSLCLKAPSVALMGGDTYKKYPHYKIPNRIYVSKQYAQESGFPYFPYLENIISADPQNDFPLGDGSGLYACIYGVVNPQKGIHIAAASCVLAGIKLKIAGPIQDYNYWNGWCNFPNVEYVGVITNTKDKIELLTKARVLLFPSVMGEGDPLGPKEALACGTPVIAAPRNGISSFLEPYLMGFFGEFPEEIAPLIWKAASLNRKLVRTIALDKLDPMPKAIKLSSLCERVYLGDKW